MNGSTRMKTAFIHGVALALALLASGCGLIQKKAEEAPDASAEAAQPALPDKGDPQARFDAAMTLWRDNQIAEAEAAFVGLAQDFPDHSGPWTNLGILFAKSNRRDQALGALGKAVTLNPKNKVAYNWLGILYRETGDLNRARLSYEKALQLDPDYALAHYNLGLLLDAHLKQPAAALPHYRAYLQSGDGQAGNADDLRVLAWIAEIEAATRPPAPQPPATGPTPEPQR